MTTCIPVNWPVYGCIVTESLLLYMKQQFYPHVGKRNHNSGHLLASGFEWSNYVTFSHHKYIFWPITSTDRCPLKWWMSPTTSDYQRHQDTTICLESSRYLSNWENWTWRYWEMHMIDTKCSISPGHQICIRWQWMNFAMCSIISSDREKRM